MAEPLRSEDPARVGEYELTARLGRGGQGVVYLGRAPGGNRVAVKVMSGSWATGDRLRSRFAKEVEAASKVAAFCTAAVLDTAPDADPPYIVSEYVDGPSLRQAVLEEGPRTGSALDRLAIATATALVAIHRAGVVHRDFKPANVLLGPDGPRVIDFGIARSSDATVTSTNSIVGTPAYMAPEQVRGHKVSFAADIFAWASVMAFAATGLSPFHSDSLPAVIHRVLHEEPRLDGVAGRLRPLLEACLDKDPERRPSAVQALGMLVGHDPAEVPRISVAEVLAEGYTAALDERTQIAATAVLPVPVGGYGDGAPSQAAASGLAKLTVPRVPGSGVGGVPASGPVRTTSGLAALVDGGGAAGRAAEGAGAGAYRGGVPPPTVSPEGGPAARSGTGGEGGDRGRGQARGPRRALWWTLAAALLVIAGAGGWLLLGDRLASSNPEATPRNDVVVGEPEPGGDEDPGTEDTFAEPVAPEEPYTPPAAIDPSGQSPPHAPSPEESDGTGHGWGEDGHGDPGSGEPGTETAGGSEGPDRSGGTGSGGTGGGSDGPDRTGGSGGTGSGGTTGGTGTGEGGGAVPGGE